ncbi:acylneuraminate cytidylyltransferase family protein [Planctobacterium marinum]|uniref:acylneuraminate cytidylyltransferase family protein n=1 Tax=Planctobacterium marinum TaxID=1631968 RepID=UPI001E645C5C|nr:acylneuraminate cytidylyltransferase family protein [Planctobacterium marinum]MCC2606133.1 acylneuraminate cytidylyltransferase family protein [Planctobacterium marinum]
MHAFIFARGGSKGLPGKNIKSLGGISLLARAIRVARQVPGISEVFVSTDDKSIAIEGEREGAIIIHRPAELACDDSPEWFAWQHAVNYVQEVYGSFDRFVSLPTTSPLRISTDILLALEKFEQSEDSDLCLAITPSSRSPYFNMGKLNQVGHFERFISHDSSVERRQDAPKSYDITTVVYVTTPEYILNNESLFDGNICTIEVPKERAVDIDDWMDFKFAEVLVKEGKRDEQQ